VDAMGETPLAAAARHDRESMIALLSGAGASANGQLGNTTEFDISPLHVAAMAEAHNSIKSLTRGGAKVDALDGKGRTPLMLAAE